MVAQNTIDRMLTMAVAHAQEKTGRTDIQQADLKYCGLATNWQDCIIAFDGQAVFHFNVVKPNGKEDTFAVTLPLN